MQGAMSDASGIPLDGDGVGPNRDSRLVPVFCIADNPASLEAFSVTRQPDSVRVEWTTGTEARTRLFLVQRAEGQGGPYATVLEVTPHGPGSYAVSDAGQSSGFYRLLEVETAGDTLLLADDEVREPFVVEPLSGPSPAAIDSISRRLQAEYPSLNHVQDIQPIYGITYVGPSAWEDELQPLMSLRQSQGHVVNFVSLESLGGWTGIQPYIIQAVPYGLWAACLVGRAEDSEWWNQSQLWINGWVRPAWPANPQWNIISSWYQRDVADSQYVSMSWFRPYWNSDWPYGDVDGDSIPEIVVTRIPATTEAEVTTAAAKIIAFDNLNTSQGRVAVLSQGRNFNGNSGQQAIDQAESLAVRIPAPYTVSKLYDSEATQYTYTQRRSMFLSAVGSTAPTTRVVAMTVTGTSTNRNNWHWYSRVQGDSWNSLPTNAGICAVAAPTCELAGHDRRIDPAYGIGMDVTALTLYPDRGPAFIWGSGTGSTQPTNAPLGESFMAYAYQYGARSAADAALRTVRKIAVENPLWKYQALSTAILGDPATRWPGMQIVTTDVADGEGSKRVFLASPYPNPSRGAVQLRFALARPAEVELSVHDVSGRKAGVVADQQYQAGSHTVHFDSNRLKSGLYFISLKVGTTVLTQKMIVLR